MKKAMSIAVLALLLGCAVSLAGEAPARQPDAFEQLLAKVQADPRRAPEEQVKQLLTMAAQRGRCHAVSLAVKSHLAHNFHAPPELLRLAAENSVLAGDFRTAAARYKSYLAASPNGEQAQEAAVALYRLLADFLGAEDDAYQFIRARGEKFRASAGARKFDSWFVEQARRRKDCAAMANALHLVLSQKLPLEQERLYFWEPLDWLMSEIVRGHKEHFDALPTCRKLVPLVRDSKRRSLRYALCVATLAFKAGSAGKDAAALGAAYGSVVAAAKAYFDAYPTAATLEDIVWAFTDGGVGSGFDDAAWQRQAAPKRSFFVYAFSRLNDKEREAILAWRLPQGGPVARRLATREQWADLGSKHAQLFGRCAAVRHLPFVVQPKSRGLYKKQAAFLRGVPSTEAAAINSMAASDDLARCVDHLIKNEAWYLGPQDAWRILDGVMWPAHRAIGKEAGKEPSHDERRKVIVHFGTAYLAKTPAALDPSAARSYIDSVWATLPDGQKIQIVEHLKSLQWVPYRGRERKSIFQGLANGVRSWAGSVRRELRRKQSKLSPEVAKQIAPVEAAFRTAMDPDAADPNLAPNPLCKALALAIVAEGKPDGEAFVQQARALYPMVKDYQAKKIPFGRSVLEYILTNRLDRFDTIDFQLEAVKEQLARLGDREPDENVRFICDTVVRTKDGRSWWGTPKDARERTLKLNALLEQALMARLGKGQFSPALFEWFRGTRSGDHWREQGRGEAVMAKVIETKALHKTDYRPDASIPSATVSYMRLVHAEFPGLNAKYPVARYFDDMFVEEAKQTGRLDWKYWDYGRDEKKKVANAAATLLGRDQKLPFDYNGAKVTYARGNFWNWQARALAAGKPARDALIAAAENAYGQTRFDTLAMGSAYFNAQADASTQGGRQAFFKRLKAYLERVRKAPVRLSPPYLGQLGKLGKEITNEELDVLLSIFPACTPTRWPRGWHFDTLARVAARGLLAHKREAELYRVLPHFWKIARDTHSTELQRELTRLAVDLAESGQHDLALVCSSVGLAMAKAELPEDARSSLVAVRSKSLSDIGGVIPVKRDDPRYPIYAAQAAYLGGRQQSAWELYLGRRPILGGMIKELDPAFCIWLIDKHTEVRDFDAAEALARKMIQWFDSVTDGFQPELRARLLLSYANIALTRREFPRARALFERIAAAREFQGTRAQGDAELRVAEVDRLTGRFDESAKRLEKLTRSKDPSLQAESYYGLAQVSFDQEEYREALGHLEQVFARVPDHADAKILEARSKVKMRKLEEATDIQIGTVTQRRFIVPGKPLRVNLEDRNLAVVGTSTDIEIRAWTESGDEEIFNLMPFGDSKTKFRGSLPTALAPAAKGDRTLQVLGNDVVHYDFSERFKREHKIALSRPETLVVTTDAELLVSSGRILSKDEREARALDQLIRRRLGEETEKQQVALSTVRREEQIKPGNKLNVRVVDPDRGETAGKDTLTIRVASSSGDSIKAFTLTETETRSGVFEGAVQTASGHAVAFASDSDDGKEPNFVISRKDYPAWVALPDNERPKTFSIDLNDNVALGKMTVAANVPGRKLKRFLVQTSLNAQDFTTVGSWPEAFQPWDGSPRMELVRHGKQNQAPSDVAAFHKYLDEGHIREATPKFHRKASTLAANFDDGVKGLADRIGLAAEGEGSWYIIHHYAAFYQPVRRRRSFDVEAKGLSEEPRRGGGQSTQYILTIDGDVGDTPTSIRRSLGKGVHRIDLYVCATRKAQPRYSVRMDIDEAPFMRACPPAMFDLEKHPQIRAGIHREPAKVAAANEGGSFGIAFAEGTRARVVRLLMADFETDAPAISKIALTDAAGKAVLPAQEDFMALRTNQVLEIIPGDRVTVSYDDPRVITQGKEHHEAFLTATFSNANVSACFVEYSVDGAGERQARYIPMRRFKPGDKISVFVNDPDCDVSDKQDTVTFTARTSEGKAAEFPALETKEHSGVFVGGVFPVAGDPKRKAEIKVVEGDDVIVTYVDKENTDPGIPWNRPCVVEQTWYEPPAIRVYSVQSQPLEKEAKEPEGGAGTTPQLEELVPVTRSLVVTWPEKHEPEKPTPVLINGPLVVEVLFPCIAQSPESAAAIYVQTASGRKAHGGKPGAAFDIKAPGTIKLRARPSNVPRVAPPPGYKEVLVRGNPFAADALDDGRFTFSVPMELAALPDKSLADEEPEDPKEQPALAIKGNDEIFIGFEFADGQGRKTWATRRVTLHADSFFDVMDRRYREPLTGVYVGESIYFRVIDPTRDTTDKKDQAAVSLAATSGATRELKLTETFTHSGIFKGHVKAVYKGEGAEAKGGAEALPCQYGDTVTAIYKRPQAEARLERKVTVHKGSDGIVLPFTKRFTDPAIAVQTQFTIAEAYFEMAKRHRALGQDELARREIAQGKKLLEEAVRDYPDTEARAQADYLLAELALEFANDAKDEEARRSHYTEAVGRFTDIVAGHPDSPYAPKAQYKKALVFEKMGQIDQACEEYVKLSYRYPDNELVAETIARLGQYFLTKGKALRKDAEGMADNVEAEKKEMQAADMHKTAAQVFGRLAVRFPDHQLAGKTSVLSAQCYMQAKDLPKAIDVFQATIKTPKMDNELVAESMYWCGDCYTRQRDFVNAYRMLKKLTWDYPASKWAKFARGRLSEEALAKAAGASEDKK